MEVIQTAIEGVVIIEPRLFNDARGYFFESFSQRNFDRIISNSNFQRSQAPQPARRHPSKITVLLTNKNTIYFRFEQL